MINKFHSILSHYILFFMDNPPPVWLFDSPFWLIGTLNAQGSLSHLFHHPSQGIFIHGLLLNLTISHIVMVPSDFLLHRLCKSHTGFYAQNFSIFVNKHKDFHWYNPDDIWNGLTLLFWRYLLPSFQKLQLIFLI